MSAAAPPIHKVPSGLVGNPGRAQEVANPGLRQKIAVSEAKRSAALRADIHGLSARIAKLEAKLATKECPTPSVGPDLAELIANLKALTCTASAEALPTSARVIGAGTHERPATAPYRVLADTTSVVSWSADAFGRSKTPGWYHTQRKQLYQMRAARAATDPTGCYVSHSKFADEAARIRATDRPAFASSKWP